MKRVEMAEVKREGEGCASLSVQIGVGGFISMWQNDGIYEPTGKSGIPEARYVSDADY
jgi:hypothetical protein